MKKIGKILTILLGLFVIILLGVYLMRNTLIEYFGEKIGSEEYGAKIDIDNVDFDLFAGILKIERVQITNKKNTMENIGDIHNLEVEIEYKPLLKKKLLIVDDLTLGLVEIYTPRKTDGTIKISGVKEEKNKETSPTPNKKSVKVVKNNEFLLLEDFGKNLNSDDYKKIMEKLNIKIVNEYEKESETVEGIYTYWEDKVKGEDYQKQLKVIEKKYKKLESKIKKEKDPLKLLDEINEINDLVKEFNKLVKKAEMDKKHFENDLKEVERIRKKAFKYVKTDDFLGDIVGWDKKKFQNQINVILNEYLSNYIDKNIDIFNLAMEDKGEQEELPIDIWVKNINIKFVHLNYTLNGKISDIATKKEIIEEPIKFKLVGNDKNIDAILKGNIDRWTQNGVVNFKIEGLKIDKGLIEKKAELAILRGTKLSISQNLKINNKIFDMDGVILLNDVKIDKKMINLKPEIKEILGDSLSKIKKIEIKYSYTGKNKKIKIKTNLDELLSDIIESIVKDNIAKYKKMAIKEGNKQISKYSKKLGLKVDKVEDLEKLFDFNVKKLEKLNMELKSGKDPKEIEKELKDLGKEFENLFK
jgi:uncharacterized protein (TIGR03545 family)